MPQTLAFGGHTGGAQRVTPGTRTLPKLLPRAPGRARYLGPTKTGHWTFHHLARGRSRDARRIARERMDSRRGVGGKMVLGCGGTLPGCLRPLPSAQRVAMSPGSQRPGCAVCETESHEVGPDPFVQRTQSPPSPGRVVGSESEGAAPRLRAGVICLAASGQIAACRPPPVHTTLREKIVFP